MTYVAGVDGCKVGWVVALRSLDTGATTLHVVSKFADVVALPKRPAVVAADVPIGLLEHAVEGGRACEPLARALLRGPRARSVFSPPVRSALSATTFAEACAANRSSSPEAIGISQQTFGLFGKLREVDAAMSPAVQKRVFEVHPELCFFEMAGARAAVFGKKTRAGRAERTRLLEAGGFPGPTRLGRGVAPDDVLDALAACWTAERIHSGRAVRIPEPPPVDARGLRMEIWR